MAYDKQKIFEQAKEVIVKHRLIFIDEIPDFLPCSRSSFYSYFPDKSDELDTLKTLISINRTQLKSSMRSKWYKSNAPALQMALMKLIATPEELKRLAMTYQDVTTDGKPLSDKPIIIDWNGAKDNTTL